MSSQYFDFTVQVGDDQQRVQIEGGYQFRALRFHARAGDEPLAIRFTPRSKWVACAILAWTAADAARVQQEIIAPAGGMDLSHAARRMGQVEGGSGTRLGPAAGAGRGRPDSAASSFTRGTTWSASIRTPSRARRTSIRRFACSPRRASSSR